VFPKGANGNIAPARIIEPPASIVPQTNATIAGGLVFLGIVDDSNNVSAINAYAAQDNGPSQPVRTIAGPHTGLAQPSGIFVR
jgi:hypothetical protein